MLAAFLRTEDGDFEYGPAFGAALFIVLLCGYAWSLYRSLETGRIAYHVNARSGSYKICWLERDKRPGWFWFAFVAYSLMIPFCAWMAYALCTGFFHKPS